MGWCCYYKNTADNGHLGRVGCQSNRHRILRIDFQCSPPVGQVCRIGEKPGGGAVLPYKRPMGMCRWMGSHFHDWIDYNGVAFSMELLEWGRRFSDFWVRQFFMFTV